MKKKIHKIISHPLISGGTVIVVGSMIANVFNYLFNVSMGRMLSIAEYAILASIISLFNIFAVFSQTIVTVFSKFSASLVGQRKTDYLGGLQKEGFLYVGSIGLVLSVCLIVFSASIAHFLRSSQNVLIIIISFGLLSSFISSVTQGVLQGMLFFGRFSILYLTTTFLKFLTGIILVYLGFKVFGATTAIFIGAFSGLIVGYLMIFRKIGSKKDGHLKIAGIKTELTKYAMPVLLSNIGLTLIYTMDIILARHFFNDIAAGQYAALSLMGRSILFVVQPLSLVFFPLIAQRKERGEKMTDVILISLCIVGIPSIVLSIFYFLYPKIILSIFFPAKAYASLTQYLGFFSIFIVFYIFSYFLNTYFLSLGKTKVWFLTITAAIFEILYIVFFHNSIQEIITGLIVIAFLLFISHLLYYFLNL